MKTLTINKSNFFETFKLILEKINQGFEIKIVFEDEEELNPEIEKTWYKDPDTPKKGDFDIIEKEFTSSDEAIKFLRN